MNQAQQMFLLIQSFNLSVNDSLNFLTHYKNVELFNTTIEQDFNSEETTIIFNSDDSALCFSNIDYWIK